ncbi:MAG: phenylalanine--tRNA ligase subunit beta [Gemmatimonadetes bacterium]|nr:phenylalanine--tRNA ligase subunit beta [Gemmatimonadota bacterium]
MLYSHDWLRALVPHDRSATDLAALIGRHVATIDALTPLRADLVPIVVARVVEAGRHPNSDHLWVTKVDDGTGALLDVVCGAPNVVAGTLYPFARVGTVMPTGNKGGILIERRKIRGEWSTGMLCSARELGLGEDHDGIMPLDLDVPTGTSLLAALPVGDTCLDVDVLPNRPDLFSQLGMAREVAALTRTRLRPLVDVVASEAGGAALTLPAATRGREAATAGGVQVRLEDRAGCPRYMAAVVRGVTVGPSPEWLVNRLASVGARSISNVVDVTNYMLHAAGQPMHAFDLARLGQATLVIRGAREGERLLALDGVERALQPEMTVIADADRAVAIAGVIGGRESEVTPTTTDVVLEVAAFDARTTRRTRRALGIQTDAAHRFERGVDAAGTAAALAAAAQLLVSVAGGRVEGIVDVGEAPPPPAPVSLSVTRLGRLLGDVVSAEEVADLLRAIGFATTREGDTLQVQPPTWRRDVVRDADLVEEVARLRGYDRLPDALTPFRPGAVPEHPYAVVTRRLQAELVAAGLHEVRPMPFVRGDDATHVRVANPLAEDEPHLRHTVAESLARRAEYNLTRMEGNVRLFEVGSVFRKTDDRLPVESLHAGVLLMGWRRPPHFTEPEPPAIDAWDARALAERLVPMAHAGAMSVEPGHGGGDLWRVHANGEEVARVFRVDLDRPVWAHEAFGIELWIGTLDSADVTPPGTHAAPPMAAPSATAHPTYRALPTQPAAEFDLALVLPPDIAAGAVEAVIRGAAGALLESLRLFDEYRGTGLPEGHRSVAWRLTFRDPSRTLRDKEVEGRRAKIVQTLEKELGIRPRGS